MSIFHETMRDILEDIQRFLNVTLQSEHLSASSISHKESLLMKIHHVRTEYPQLHLQLILESSKRGPNSPPPYIDMQGHHSTEYVCSDSVEEDYEVCDVFDGDDAKSNKDYKSLESNGKLCYGSGTPERNRTYLKSGYLEKKRKERLGGLLNTSQRRWVALSQDCLLFFNKSGDKRVNSHLPLAGYSVRQICLTAKDGTKKDGYFELVGPGLKTYQFLAGNQNEAKEWTEVIHRCISSLEKRRDGSGPLLPALPAIPTLSSYSDESQCSSGDGSLIARSSSTEAYKKEELVVGDEVYEVVEDVSSLVNSNNSEVLAIHEDLYQDTEVGDSKSSYPLDLYVGLWDCIAIAKDELNFKRGDVIKIISKEYDDYQWWIGELNVLFAEYAAQAQQRNERCRVFYCSTRF